MELLILLLAVIGFCTVLYALGVGRKVADPWVRCPHCGERFSR